MVNLAINGFMCLHRGDTFKIPLIIKQCGIENYIQNYIQNHSNITFYFGLLESNQKFEDAVIRKILTSEDINEENNLILEFKSSDTEFLLPGKYYYTIKAESDSGIDTVIPRTDFLILE